MTKLHVTPVHPDKATGEVKKHYDKFKKAIGKVPNFIQTMAVSPAFLDGFIHLHNALYSGKLDPKIREQVAILIAQKNGCNYCMSAHTYFGKAAGLSQDELFKAREHQASDPKTSAILKFAQAVLDKKGGISDSDWQAIRQSGLTDEEILEIIGLVTLNTLTNFFNKAAGTEIDFPLVSTETIQK